jgi:hypothetical protein
MHSQSNPRRKGRTRDDSGLDECKWKQLDFIMVLCKVAGSSPG